MPLYEFRCGLCGATREELWFTSGPTPPMCCGGMMKKILSPSMLEFKKGSGGFYSADNKQTETEVESDT